MWAGGPAPEPIPIRAHELQPAIRVRRRVFVGDPRLIVLDIQVDRSWRNSVRPQGCPVAENEKTAPEAVHYKPHSPLRPNTRHGSTGRTRPPSSRGGDVACSPSYPTAGQLSMSIKYII